MSACGCSAVGLLKLSGDCVFLPYENYRNLKVVTSEKEKKCYFLCVVYPQLFRNPLNNFISYSNVCFISVYRPLMYD